MHTGSGNGGTHGGIVDGHGDLHAVGKHHDGSVAAVKGKELAGSHVRASAAVDNLVESVDNLKANLTGIAASNPAEADGRTSADADNCSVVSSLVRQTLVGHTVGSHSIAVLHQIDGVAVPTIAPAILGVEGNVAAAIGTVGGSVDSNHIGGRGGRAVGNHTEGVAGHSGQASNSIGITRDASGNNGAVVINSIGSTGVGIAPVEGDAVGGDTAGSKTSDRHAGRRQIEHHAVDIEVVHIIGSVLEAHILGAGGQNLAVELICGVQQTSLLGAPSEGRSIIGGGGVTKLEAFRIAGALNLVHEAHLNTVLRTAQLGRDEVLRRIGVVSETEGAAAAICTRTGKTSAASNISNSPAVQRSTALLEVLNIGDSDGGAGGDEGKGLRGAAVVGAGGIAADGYVAIVGGDRGQVVQGHAVAGGDNRRGVAASGPVVEREVIQGAVLQLAGDNDGGAVGVNIGQLEVAEFRHAAGGQRGEVHMAPLAVGGAVAHGTHIEPVVGIGGEAGEGHHVAGGANSLGEQDAVVDGTGAIGNLPSGLHIAGIPVDIDTVGGDVLSNDVVDGEAGRRVGSAELQLRQEVLHSASGNSLISGVAIAVTAGASGRHTVEGAAGIARADRKTELNEQVATVVGEGAVEGDGHTVGGVGSEVASVVGGEGGAIPTGTEVGLSGDTHLHIPCTISPVLTAATAYTVLHRGVGVAHQIGEHRSGIDGLHSLSSICIEAIERHIAVGGGTLGNGGAVGRQAVGGDGGHHGVTKSANQRLLAGDIDVVGGVRGEAEERHAALGNSLPSEIVGVAGSLHGDVPFGLTVAAVPHSREGVVCDGVAMEVSDSQRHRNVLLNQYTIYPCIETVVTIVTDSKLLSSGRNKSLIGLPIIATSGGHTIVQPDGAVVLVDIAKVKCVG